MDNIQGSKGKGEVLCLFISSQRNIMILWFQTPRKPVIGDGCDQEDTKDHQYAAKDKFQQ